MISSAKSIIAQVAVPGLSFARILDLPAARAQASLGGRKVWGSPRSRCNKRPSLNFQGRKVPCRPFRLGRTSNHLRTLQTDSILGFRGWLLTEEVPPGG